MQNIHIQRFKQSVGFAGQVEADDRSWIVFVDDNGEPSLWRRVEITTGEGKVEHAYADVEQVCAITTGLPEPEQSAESALDYEVTEIEGVFEARLNARHIVAIGATEHEAVARLINYVAQLCTAGSLDHTGRPAVSNSRRRRLVG